MKRYKVKVSNLSKNVKFEMDLLAESIEQAKELAFPYASEKIASFMSPYHPKDQRHQHAAYVEGQLTAMTEVRRNPYWDPASMIVEVQDYPEPVIAFAWDLINKPTR